MLTHVQTLLSRLYKIACTMIQYVLRIVLRFCPISLCFTLYRFLAWLFIRVFEFERWQNHTLYIHTKSVSVCNHLF